VVATALGLVGVYLFPIVHRLFHALRNPLLMTLLGGAVLGLLTWALVVWLLAGFALATSLATVVQAANSSTVVATLNRM
ncbi:hypothetical protein SB773_34510, partial [Bacillus sp. SIMBA_074]|uniref:hypothetical protein n=1 Tax=Bacillus sp. SIMBA_074 TaxID=3085812 RepID=UPI00397B1BFE